MRPARLLFLLLAPLASALQSSVQDDGKIAGYPNVHSDNPAAAHDTPPTSRSCPLKDNCPLYAAVIREAHASIESLNAPDINWSIAAQSPSSSIHLFRLIPECPLAHVCPYLRNNPVDEQEPGTIPGDHHIQDLLAKCPQLANSPQAKHHIASVISSEYPSLAPAGKCPYLARPDEDAGPLVWEEFYRRSAECPWIQRNGIADLSKSPKAWEAALGVVPH